MIKHDTPSYITLKELVKALKNGAIITVIPVCKSMKNVPTDIQKKNFTNIKKNY